MYVAFFFFFFFYCENFSEQITHDVVQQPQAVKQNAIECMLFIGYSIQTMPGCAGSMKCSYWLAGSSADFRNAMQTVKDTNTGQEHSD